MKNEFWNDILLSISEDKIALFFLSYMSVVLILNIIRFVILFVYERELTKSMPCEHLQRDGIYQRCKDSSYKKRFADYNNSCEGCFGRSVEIQREAVERGAKKKNLLTYIIIVLANIGRAFLPYTAILFTMLSKIRPTI